MGTPAPVPGIRGREEETAVLADAIDRAVSGRLAVVLIDGEAGIGKTRLLEDALEKARGRGLQVAAGRAADLEQTRPFGLVAAMFGGTRSSPDPLPAAIIGCFRPAPRVAALERLAGALETAGGRRLSLRELDGQAVAELVADSVGAAPGRRLLAGISGAAGNPLFVTELLGALAQERMITISDGRAEVTDLTLPPTLRLTILRRISFLPEGTLQALRFASILGSGFTLTDLAVVTGRSAVDLSMSLAEPIGARVLEDDGARLRFRHDLIRDA